jgi:hypothetical protein
VPRLAYSRGRACTNFYVKSGTLTGTVVEYLEAKHVSLVTQLCRWVKSKGKEYLGCRAPTTHVEMLKSQYEDIDPLKAMQLIFSIQFDRLMIDYATETKINKCLNSNTNSMRLAMDMISAMDEIGAQKSIRPNQSSNEDSSGNMDRIRREYESRFGANAAMVALNPESRRRVFLALEKVKKGNLASVQELLRRNTQTAKDLGYNVEAELNRS